MHSPDPSQPHSPIETLAAGRFLRLVRENGWEYVQRANCHDVVSIIAATPDANILLIEQHRPPLHARTIELPAGLAGDTAAGREDLILSAQRELLEETGYRAQHFELAAAGPTSSGMSDERITYFIATQLTRESAGGGVEGEDILVHEVPLAEIHPWLAAKQSQGILIDPRVFIGLYFLTRERQGA